MRLISKAEGAGKSKEWFLQTADGHFRLKACSRTEANTMLRMLPDYLQHVRERHHATTSPRTLLPRFYGLYSLQVEGFEAVRFFIMANVLAGHFPILERFDVKGSTVGRAATAREVAKGGKAVLQDLDLLQRAGPFASGPRSPSGTSGAARGRSGTRSRTRASRRRGGRTRRCSHTVAEATHATTAGERAVQGVAPSAHRPRQFRPGHRPPRPRRPCRPRGPRTRRAGAGAPWPPVAAGEAPNRRLPPLRAESPWRSVAGDGDSVRRRRLPLRRS